MLNPFRKMRYLLMCMLLVRAFDDVDDRCSRHAYLKHMWTKKIRNSVPLEVSFDEVRKDLKLLHAWVSNYNEFLTIELMNATALKTELNSTKAFHEALAVPSMTANKFFTVTSNYSA